MIRKLFRYIQVIVILGLAALYALSTTWQDAEVWHTADLDEEYNRDREDVRDFEDYLDLEKRLFQQMQFMIYDQTPSGPEHRIERYSRGSAADPNSRKPNWNRSFELKAPQPRGGVLLLHGMSDSPYSLRALGETLNQQGYQVVGLRLPGHGTAPSGLTGFEWEDMSAAVRLAMRHLQEGAGKERVHIIGYSNGAPLALDFALNAETDPEFGLPASLVLVSPAVGISPAAVMAQWTRRLSHLPGLENLAWLDMLPEFDPYKYNSFATNAAEQVRRLTLSVAARIKARNANGEAPPFPPILVLKSAVDATVSTRAVVDNLLIHLQSGRHEYVLFDINRAAANTSILISDPGPLTEQLVNDSVLPFTLTVIGNESADSTKLVARQKPPFSNEVTIVGPLDAEWPKQTISLSHIALPFPLDDPLYGAENPENENEIYLGQVAIQGERGLLTFSSDWLIRLRHNPFYDYLETRVVDWIEQASGQ